MSTEVLKSEENKEFDCIALSDQKQTEESNQNDISEDKNFIPFTKKWRLNYTY